MVSYQGKISITGDTAYLTAGGLKVKLEADAATFTPYDGTNITVSGEQVGDVIKAAAPMPEQENAAVENPFAVFYPAIQVIETHAELFNQPGIFSARPAFHPDEPDPVISVLLKPDTTPTGIPDKINGIKIETGIATPLEILQGPIPLSAWKGSDIEAGPPAIHYQPPTNVSLEKMEVKKITCHIGPDAGWTTLKPFLEATEKSLTVAMYEFYADHIIETVTTLGEQTDAQLNIILQVSANDKTIEETLSESWPERLDFVKASVSGPNRLFNNSYHTKVAVRDSKAMWLSSGNWSPNSQPLLESESDQFVYRRGNREWHVIVEDKPFSVMYEKFIRFDMEEARAITQPEASQILPDLLIPTNISVAEAAIVQPAFKPATFGDAEDPISVQPLMSPDNYAPEILKLIKKAKTSLYLQFSYINQPSTLIFNDIIDAVSAKIKEGLDVKILVGSSQKPDAVTLLIARGWKTKYFKKQSQKIHNKGILIDGKIAVVGSNNWSSDGTQYNRDTSLVFYSKPITQYYTEVFLFDWNNLSRPVISAPEITPIIAPESGPTPLGMIRIPWQAWYDE